MGTLTISREAQTATVPAGHRDGFTASTDGDYVYLYRLLGGRFSLARPVLLNVERGEDGEVVVFVDSLRTYGAGSTVDEAVEEFQSMLIDLYEELHGCRDRLSWALLDTLHRICYHMGER